MGKIRIFNGNNSVYISDRAYQPGSLTASNRGDDVRIVKDTNNKTIVNDISYDLIVDKDGNAWGTDGPSTVTALNNYIGATNPDGIVKSTDKITSLSGITESDFQNKPGFGVFVGDTDGSLKTSPEIIFDGTNFNVDGGLYFVGDKTIGSTGTFGTITIDPVTAINFFGEYSFPTTDGSSGQVLTTNGSGTLSFTTVSGSGSSPWTTSGSDIYYTTGNVGVGTTTPSKTLHVTGDSQIDGTLLLKTQYNAVILGSTTTGGGNSAQADSNVIIGHGAMASYTYGNGISYRNVAVGRSALNSGTGAYNVAVGRDAMSGSQTRSNTIGIGNAAFQNGGGTNGVGIGGSAGRYATGNYNVLLGCFSGQGSSGTSTFSNTVAVGHEAGKALTNGGNNILIGYQAGSTLTTESNKLYIENSNSATPLIYGEFDNDLIRVNGDLEVKGYADVELGASETFTVHDGTHDLFQVDTGTTGTIFSVNDVSGLPKLTVDDSDGVTIDKFKEVKYEKPSNTDFSYQGDVVYFGATTSMTQGDLYYFNSSGNWAQADADAVSSSGGVLLAIALGTASDANGMLLKGTFTMAAGAIDGTEATGDELYVGTTAGHVTSDVSAYTTGDVVRVVGYCLDGTNGQIWFNPSNDWIELS